MLTDIDLDVRNYIEKQMGEDEAVIFYHVDLKDGDVVCIADGETHDLVNMLISHKDCFDVVVMAAAHIVKENDIDFEKVKNELEL